MDGAIVVAALILNPIARRKRAAQASELIQIAEAPTISTGTGGTEGSNPLEKSDLESGDRAAVAVGRNLVGA
jgi:hypothetical protein